jgi:hypothetical protein
MKATLRRSYWRRTQRFLVLMLVVVLALGALPVMAMSDTPTYTEEWDGRGSDSERCDYMGQEGRPETGWIHWVFNTKGDSTNASLTLGGTGSGTYEPGPPLNAEIWHFYTPFFELEGLTAVIELFGGDPGPGGGLVISDYCPGQFEMLEVTKTVETSFVREHFWDITKKVETEEGHELDGFPKIWLYIDGSGDETATWTIDVTYEDYKDDDWNVSGDITIKNIGALDAVITTVEDVLGGMPIDVDCGVTFPYTLPAGETLICTYDEDVDDFVEGFNEVTVTTERDIYEAEPVAIIWGEPAEEVNKTVSVKDISDLFGEVDLGTVTAPNDAQFTYDKLFAWEDYGADNCGSFLFENMAMIVETEQEASAALKVNVQCFLYETAYAKGDSAICFIPTFSNWGWTNPIMPGTYEMELWAAAGQCDNSKGSLVGTVTVEYVGGIVTEHYNVELPYLLQETHFFAGYEMFPRGSNGRFTIAPGQYTNEGPFDGSQVYVIAHAVVGLPDPNFGPVGGTMSLLGGGVAPSSMQVGQTFNIFLAALTR